MVEACPLQVLSSLSVYLQRQVGFDKEHRPVIYSCFAQAATRKNVVEDSVAHCTYLLENAQKTMRDGLGKWVWVLDCTGELHVMALSVKVDKQTTLEYTFSMMLRLFWEPNIFHGYLI